MYRAVHPSDAVLRRPKRSMDAPTVMNLGQLGQISGVTREQRRIRARYFDHSLPYAWVRIALSLGSYLMLASDVPRSGVGIKSLQAENHTMLEPDVIQFAGPFHYPVRNATNVSVPVWSYKFDTTSIVWRGFAQFYNLSTFPPCLQYNHKCPNITLPDMVTFAMIDSMVNATAQRSLAAATRRGHQDPAVVVLRTRNNFLDRANHYILPRLFMRPSWRTNRAIYYAPSTIKRPDFSICSNGRHRPDSCEERWVNYRRSCRQIDSDCRSVGLIWDHIQDRVRAVQAQYPGHEVDLTILESAEDIQVCKGGISFLGRRDADVSSIVRARRCYSIDKCETVYVDDYRYETTTATSDIVQWYRAVFWLRVFGQTYFYLRMVMLFVGCYVARAAEYQGKSSWGTNMHRAFMLFLRLPSQTVVYGSVLPVLAYVVAHVIDAPTTYEILERRFTTA